MRISCVVPAFNEESRLRGTLRQVTEYLAGRGPDYEIIVVDDGSTDRTTDVALAHAARDPRCRLIRQGRNCGKGAAVRRGVAEATGTLVLFTDADLSTPIEEEAKLRQALEAGHDIAIGSRALPDSRVELHQPWFRELMGKTYNRLIRLFLIGGIRDTQCGFKMFRAEAAREIFPLGRIDRFGFDVEILYIARLNGHRIAEVPVRWINSPQSKVRVLRDSTRMLTDLASVWFAGLAGSYRAGRGRTRPQPPPG